METARLHERRHSSPAAARPGDLGGRAGTGRWEAPGWVAGDLQPRERRQGNVSRAVRGAIQSWPGHDGQGRVERDLPRRASSLPVRKHDDQVRRLVGTKLSCERGRRGDVVPRLPDAGGHVSARRIQHDGPHDRGRFGPINRLPRTIEWLSDNGLGYIAKETRAFARDLGFEPLTTPVTSPQSKGMAEAFVRTIKREYASVDLLPVRQDRHRSLAALVRPLQRRSPAQRSALSIAASFIAAQSNQGGRVRSLRGSNSRRVVRRADETCVGSGNPALQTK